MLSPAVTGSGESDFVIAMSACVIAVVVSVSELFAGAGSVGSPAAVTVLEIVVLLATLLFTLTTMVKTAVSPLATFPFENVTLPVPPTAGALVDQPVPVVTAAETKVVLVGVGSVTVTLVSLDGPLLTKLMV